MVVRWLFQPGGGEFDYGEEAGSLHGRFAVLGEPGICPDFAFFRNGGDPD